MQQPLINPENESIKKAFLTTSIVLYLQACHHQLEEEAEAGILPFLLANASSDSAGNSSAGSNTGKGNSAGQAGKGSGHDDDDHNLGSGMVNNVGQVTQDDNEFMEIDAVSKARRYQSDKENRDMEEEAATSPGGTGDNRVVGGVNPEADEIDWNDATDEGTKDADAATS